jgi:hypothetical protein
MPFTVEQKRPTGIVGMKYKVFMEGKQEVLEISESSTFITYVLYFK